MSPLMLVLVIVLLVVVLGGGYGWRSGYYGHMEYGGGLVGLILVVLLILFLTGYLR